MDGEFLTYKWLFPKYGAEIAFFMFETIGLFLCFFWFHAVPLLSYAGLIRFGCQLLEEFVCYRCSRFFGVAPCCLVVLLFCVFVGVSFWILPDWPTF